MSQFPYTLPQIDWMALAPVLIVLCTGIAALIVEMVRPRQNNNVIVGVSLAGLAAAFVATLPLFAMPEGDSFGGMVRVDGLAAALQLILIGVCFVAFLFSEPYLRARKIPWGEFYPLALWSTAGGMMMVSTSNLLMLFLGLEVLSIALYCMAGMAREERRSEESALKYFLLGAFASAFLLLGIAFIYGSTGSVDLAALAEVGSVEIGERGSFAILGIGLILVGLGFKMALVPFHQWTPDVYQGAPTNVTAFMAAASKTAAVGSLFRFVSYSGDFAEFWYPALYAIAILTMVVGNFAALMQHDVKRMLGYSSIANAGYILVAILASQGPGGVGGYGTVAYYLVVYAFATLGAFGVISLAAKDGRESTRFTDLNGLWKRSPLAGVALLIFMASLVGMPPLGGFFGKWLIFNDALRADMLPLAIVLAITSAASAAYYLKAVKHAFVDDEGVFTDRISEPKPGLRLSLIVCAIAVVALALFLTPVQRFLGGDSPPAYTSRR